MKVKERILQLLSDIESSSVKEMVERLDVSKQALHLALRQLLTHKQVLKYGKAPKTIYKLPPSQSTEDFSDHFLAAEHIEFLKNNYITITDSGEIQYGLPAFQYWCKHRQLPLQKTFQDYLKIFHKNQNYIETNGLINGLSKLSKTKELKNIYLDHLYFLNFDSMDQFDKTKLGTLVYYAKFGQNKILMKALLQEIKTQIYSFIKLESFDCIAFIPPTVRRENQLMKFLESNLKIILQKIEIKKISGIIPIPQKSLSSYKEKVINAENGFMISGIHEFKHLLLVDDIVESGATMNAIARQIKLKKIAKKVTGLSLVGDFHKIQLA